MDKGFINLFKGKYERAFEFFRENNEQYLCGYCKLLLGDKQEAKRIWYGLDDDSSVVVKWGKSLIECLELYIANYPSYLQLRNFFESDLDMLIQAKQIHFAENLISCVDVLQQINPEIYKYVARVLWIHRYYKICFDYLNLSKRVCDNQDPEVFYISARLYCDLREFDKAKRELEILLEIEPDYFPAKHLLQSIVNLL